MKDEKGMSARGTYSSKTVFSSEGEKVGSEESVKIPFKACLTVAVSSNFPVKNDVSTLTDLQSVQKRDCVQTSVIPVWRFSTS